MALLWGGDPWACGGGRVRAEGEDKPVWRCILCLMGTSGAKSLSCGEVVMRGSGRVWPLPPPRMVPTLVEAQ